MSFNFLRTYEDYKFRENCQPGERGRWSRFSNDWPSFIRLRHRFHSVYRAIIGRRGDFLRGDHKWHYNDDDGFVAGNSKNHAGLIHFIPIVGQILYYAEGFVFGNWTRSSKGSRIWSAVTGLFLPQIALGLARHALGLALIIPATPFVLIYHAGKHLSARSRIIKAPISQKARTQSHENITDLPTPANGEAKLFTKVQKAKQALKALHSELSEKLSDEKTARGNLSNEHDKKDI